jgi:redox-sensing transcriptional repressor
VQVPEGVWVRYIDPVAIIHSLTYYLAREEAGEAPAHPITDDDE